MRLRQFDQTLATTAAALERGPDGVPTEFIVTLHTLRAQAFNERGDYVSGRKAASAAIDTPGEGGAGLEGLAAFVRLGARMQRSLSHFKLGDVADAHRDIDATITGFERLRDLPVLRALARSPEFASFESGIWFAKGSLLDSESRSDEALGAYTRAERVERNSNTAAVARGYALARTGAFEAASTAFDDALPRAASDKERSEALAGKGLALVRLQRFEDAVTALHAALDARLTDPDDDPSVFELLGIAYDALQRNGAARRAFRRAWTLTAEDKRSGNLARGITAAELRLNDPKAALEFLDSLPPALAGDRTLLFNQALALDALGRRRAAIGALVQARDAGLQRAQQELDRLDAPAGLGRWTHYWFGAQARPGRRVAGSILVAVAAAALTAPLLQWWFARTLDWYLLLLPSAVALVLLALPNMKSITVEAGKLKLSAEPLPANARDTTAGPTPESFHVPVLGAVVMASRSTLSSGAG
jgi:tetratricopeptide (TPR) repeat protein